MKEKTNINAIDSSNIFKEFFSDRFFLNTRLLVDAICRESDFGSSSHFLRLMKSFVKIKTDIDSFIKNISAAELPAFKNCINNNLYVSHNTNDIHGKERTALQEKFFEYIENYWNYKTGQAGYEIYNLGAEKYIKNAIRSPLEKHIKVAIVGLARNPVKDFTTLDYILNVFEESVPSVEYFPDLYDKLTSFNNQIKNIVETLLSGINNRFCQNIIKTQGIKTNESGEIERLGENPFHIQEFLDANINTGRGESMKNIIIKHIINKLESFISEHNKQFASNVDLGRSHEMDIPSTEPDTTSTSSSSDSDSYPRPAAMLAPEILTHSPATHEAIRDFSAIASYYPKVPTYIAGSNALVSPHSTNLPHWQTIPSQSFYSNAPGISVKRTYIISQVAPSQPFYTISQVAPSQSFYTQLSLLGKPSSINTSHNNLYYNTQPSDSASLSGNSGMPKQLSYIKTLVNLDRIPFQHIIETKILAIFKNILANNTIQSIETPAIFPDIHFEGFCEYLQKKSLNISSVSKVVITTLRMQIERNAYDANQPFEDIVKPAFIAALKSYRNAMGENDLFTKFKIEFCDFVKNYWDLCESGKNALNESNMTDALNNSILSLKPPLLSFSDASGKELIRGTPKDAVSNIQKIFTEIYNYQNQADDGSSSNNIPNLDILHEKIKNPFASIVKMRSICVINKKDLKNAVENGLTHSLCQNIIAKIYNSSDGKFLDNIISSELHALDVRKSVKEEFYQIVKAKIDKETKCFASHYNKMSLGSNSGSSEGLYDISALFSSNPDEKIPDFPIPIEHSAKKARITEGVLPQQTNSAVFDEVVCDGLILLGSVAEDLESTEFGDR
ncbi:MAG: hypothetical protein SFT91_03350 [Rickettsiaceae bacterium]|nr:hypothetical protein [Rickettsiaceae bacterium]